MFLCIIYASKYWQEALSCLLWNDWSHKIYNWDGVMFTQDFYCFFCIVLIYFIHFSHNRISSGLDFWSQFYGICPDKFLRFVFDFWAKTYFYVIRINFPFLLFKLQRKSQNVLFCLQITASILTNFHKQTNPTISWKLPRFSFLMQYKTHTHTANKRHIRNSSVASCSRAQFPVHPPSIVNSKYTRPQDT